MSRIGLIAMSGKPYHAGHDMLVRLASEENDAVHLYVSTSDRARKGEVPILGADMLKLWKGTIEPSLPTNVAVTYGGSPVSNIWKELGAASQAASDDVFRIYGDPQDLAQSFTEDLFAKYSGNLMERGQIILRAVERSSTVDVSGTQMRTFLQAGDKTSFVERLPTTIDRDLVWDTLSTTARNPPKVKRTAGPTRRRARTDEALLRSYIELVTQRR